MAENGEKDIALVTGASSGIGKELANQLAAGGSRVIVSARSISNARDVVDSLPYKSSAFPIQIDVSSSSSVLLARDIIARKFGHIDILINNAAARFDYEAHAVDVPLADIEASLNVNLFGAWRMIQAFRPLLLKSKHATVVNVSSGAGSFSDSRFGLAANAGSIPGYAVSKAALNALTVILSRELRADRIRINAVCPGLTASRPEMMDIPGARTVEESARSILTSRLVGADGPSGGFFRDGDTLGW